MLNISPIPSAAGTVDGKIHQGKDGKQQSDPWLHNPSLMPPWAKQNVNHNNNITLQVIDDEVEDYVHLIGIPRLDNSMKESTITALVIKVLEKMPISNMMTPKDWHFWITRMCQEWEVNCWPNSTIVAQAMAAKLSTHLNISGKTDFHMALVMINHTYSKKQALSAHDVWLNYKFNLNAPYRVHIMNFLESIKSDGYRFTGFIGQLIHSKTLHSPYGECFRRVEVRTSANLSDMDWFYSIAQQMEVEPSYPFRKSTKMAL